MRHRRGGNGVGGTRGVRARIERQGVAVARERVGRRARGGGCLGGDAGGEANALSWRRAASPDKRLLDVLPRGALHVPEGFAISGGETR